MFAKNSLPEGDYKDVETIIGASVKVEGNFVCDGSMVIDGEVKGNVKTSKNLNVGVKALIVADVQSGNARVAGEIRGNLKVNGLLELLESAKINGDVQAVALIIAKGAILNGHCTMSETVSTVNQEEIEEA
ncbi:cell shape determination protein CcmA [Candidatus Falkowbacteria bacterium CG10_big_fil_rev_8_21_14_0_10_37_14]|uniref:Cell shape determination protein CcmA n=1 Tax=Candidatus Falkowbacteria bacterium CG10_big_fil_rev_8_21_14_0_10_37_14 TaxID=1974561 RepID=A0A2M6WUQ5_9BACT|nr:polymer-forming cytoskeletal protein [Candidatus Falkowbacteria bacterium]PIT96510.1 MAG: cell shape determination protein CcmA [Candidatus Falkowbacteria bacterium CG10_big_fil_rev_8_21_14_0_10_37_14]